MIPFIKHCSFQNAYKHSVRSAKWHHATPNSNVITHPLDFAESSTELRCSKLCNLNALRIISKRAL
jgi:hypothetical protein